MKEVSQILTHFTDPAESARAFVLATVVRVVGSAYRRPGARMLIDEHGIVEGSVSGGCLEKDVLLRARASVAKNLPVVVRYDSTEDDNEVGGFRLGCEGVIDILIEPVSRGMRNLEFSFLGRCLRERRAGVIA